MTSGPVAVLGAGGHAGVVAEALRLAGVSVIGHVAPGPSDDAFDLGPYLGTDEDLPGLLARADLAIGIGFVDGQGSLRRRALLRLVDTLGARLRTVVHPQAIVAPSATLEEGAFVAMGAIVGVRAQIGRGAIVNSGAIVDHDCLLGANTHVATGARLAGGVTVGADVLVGTGSTVRQGQRIADRAIVAAGAVVVRDVAEGVTVMGNPARVRR